MVERLPGALLAVVGAGLLGVLLTDLPGGGQGVGYASFVLVTVGGAGVLALVLGAQSLLARRVHRPTVLLASYAAVGGVYVVGTRSLLGLSPGEFVVVAVVIVVAVVAGTHHVTPSD